MPLSQREGFHVSLAGVHGASWPSASTRSPAAPWDPPPAHPRLPPPDQRQGQALHPHDALSSGWPMVRSTATATSAPPPLTAGSGTTTVSEDTQPSATSPRSLVLTREEPTFSGLTPRSHGCAFEAARFAERATREDNRRSNGRRATPRPRPTRLAALAARRPA